MLGVIISVAAVIAAVAIATGAHARVTAQIQSLGLNLLLVLSGSFSAGGIRRGAGNAATITEDDARALCRCVRRDIVYFPACLTSSSSAGARPVS
jgi:putative ABC transport system permease protein